MKNKIAPTPITGRSIELLQAINDAAAFLQRSAQSETAVFHAYQEQLAKLKLRGGLSLLDETGDNLVVRTVNYSGRVGRMLRRFERMIGVKTKDYAFPTAKVTAYRQVLESGQTQYIADSSIVIVEMVPERAKRYLGRIITLFGSDPAIYAPLITNEQVIGVINIVGSDLSPDDMPALTAFANQIAVALENASLLQQTRQYARELEKRVASRTRELEAANDRLMELDRLKSQLISNVSHELRTPITTLELYLDLIKQGDPQKHDHYFQVIEEQSHRLKQLVEEILNLSRLEAGRKNLEFGLVQLNQVIEQVVEIQQECAQDKGLTLSFAPDPDLPLIEGIESQLSQVAVNLVSNSINYTANGGITIHTYLESQYDRICLQVQDTGDGIHPKDQPYVFDRFYRGQHHAREQVPGTGLGLAIVKEIVAIHSGEIELESDAGSGTTFRIWLPLSQRD